MDLVIYSTAIEIHVIHVCSLEQVVKLLHCESKRGSTLLFYVAGNRVTRLMQKLYSNERALTKILR